MSSRVDSISVIKGLLDDQSRRSQESDLHPSATRHGFAFVVNSTGGQDDVPNLNDIESSDVAMKLELAAIDMNDSEAMKLTEAGEIGPLAGAMALVPDIDDNSTGVTKKESPPQAALAETTLAPPAFERRLRPRVPQEPGAVAVTPTNSANRRDEYTLSHASSQSTLSSTSLYGTAEQVLSATLVGDDANARENDDEVVMAVPAPKGFRAILMNRWFKYVVGFFIVVLLSVILPLYLPGKSQGQGEMEPEIVLCGNASFFQKDYRGTVATTVSGKTCARWDVFDTAVNTELAENYCRNSEQNLGGAWCYTANKSAELCAVPICETGQLGPLKQVLHETCGTMRLQQRDYRGNISITASGKECQPWGLQTPHQHTRTPIKFPFGGLDENYCRNPDGEASLWCYTNFSDCRWESCDVIACEVQHPSNPNPSFTPRRKCGEYALRQADYRGDINIAVNGKRCTQWARSDLAVENGHTHVNYPWSGLVGDFCRNPDGERERAFCYLEDGSWEYCDVPFCDRECGPFNLKAEDYRGIVSYTSSGKECLPWADQMEVLAPLLGVEQDPGLLTTWGLESNNCRNPQAVKDTGWCFVRSREGGIDWEYCSLCEGIHEMLPVRTTCGTLSIGQADYRGNISTTLSNLTCQAWGSQEPHDHKLIPEDRIHDGLDGNACRNPDRSELAWCFTTDPDVLWEYCDVPICS